MQDILVLIIIWSAVFYTVYQIVKAFIPQKNKNLSKCDGCSGCSLKPNTGITFKFNSNTKFTVDR